MQNGKYQHNIKVLLLFATGLIATMLFFSIPRRPGVVYAQHPTVSIPTVTGTPAGPVITVPSNLNQVPVRSGPGQNYPEIGFLVMGQQAPGLGTSPGGEWIKIVYIGVPGGTGWVYGNLVLLSGVLPVVPAPPTPTPRVTPTLNPTLAAQVPANAPATRLPTYTAVPPLIVPTLAVEQPGFIASRNIPMGLIIVGLAVVGLFGTLISFLRGR
jgi:hypothetical protein